MGRCKGYLASSRSEKSITGGWLHTIRQPTACNREVFSMPDLLAATDNGQQASNRLTAKHPLQLVS